MSRRIQPSTRYPTYWEFENQPILLLGGSREDNLFQIPDLQQHLDLLHSAGGNYVRCTMSSRDEGDVWPFERREDGLYDLNRPSREFWCRFSRFLALTYSLSIMVQVEVWATFDYYRDNWAVNPFNPKNNVNYTSEDAKLPVEVDSHPVRHENPFFYTVPAAKNNRLVLDYQQQFVDSLLAHALLYPNVLYCMDNETNVTPEWPRFWAEYIRDQANISRVNVHLTEMWDAHDLSHPSHQATFAHPETYTFVDVSQNNHQVGQMHWDNALRARDEIQGRQIRPMNNVKVYGSDAYRFGSDVDGIERFWRNILTGMASTRFHRPPAGLGLSATAQAHIRSARMLTDTINVFACQPHNDLLSDRAENQAYCMAQPDQEAAVVFLQPGAVTLDASRMRGHLSVRWLDISASSWLPPEQAAGGGPLVLTPPGPGLHGVVVQLAQG